MKFGEGLLVNCPYDDEKLDFEEQEYNSGEITETVSCPKCHRVFEIRYVAKEWKETS